MRTEHLSFSVDIHKPGVPKNAYEIISALKPEEITDEHRSWCIAERLDVYDSWDVLVRMPESDASTPELHVTFTPLADDEDVPDNDLYVNLDCSAHERLEPLPDGATLYAYIWLGMISDPYGEFHATPAEAAAAMRASIVKNWEDHDDPAEKVRVLAKADALAAAFIANPAMIHAMNTEDGEWVTFENAKIILTPVVKIA